MSIGDDTIADLFQGLGPVTIRRMFGGKGIYHDGRIIAVELRDGLMLKGDAETRPFYEAGGATQWTYAGKKSQVSMPYWFVPEPLFDDPDEFTTWARMAFGAALRAGTKGKG